VRLGLWFGFVPLTLLGDSHDGVRDRAGDRQARTGGAWRAQGFLKRPTGQRPWRPGCAQPCWVTRQMRSAAGSVQRGGPDWGSPCGLDGWEACRSPRMLAQELLYARLWAGRCLSGGCLASRRRGAANMCQAPTHVAQSGLFSCPCGSQ
jgi:hypothetical protein